MLNKIVSFSLRNRLVVLIVAVLLTVMGIYTVQRMEVDVFPDLNAPTVVVMTEAGGMAAEEVERVVTFPIETALNGATDVRRVRSQSTAGFSVVWVEFDWGTDIYVARQIVSERLAAVGEGLPSNVGTPTLGPQSSILGELMIIGLTADSTSMLDLRTLADWTVRTRLLSLSGVAQVAVIGGDICEYQIQLSTERMKRLGVSVNEVLAATREMNQNASGGTLYEYGNEYIMRGVMSTTDIEELGKGVIKKTASGQPILIEDVADVAIGAKSPQLGLASERGKPAVLVTITKQPETSTIQLTNDIDRVVEEFRELLPEDIKISTDVFRQASFIESSISNVQKAIMEGAFFVVIVLFLFLMNWRVTTISVVALPISVLMSMLVLKALGLTINTMSLGGIAIAIGSLVDDAIIDVENVFKRLRENHRRAPEERTGVLKVILDASMEIRTSIVHATIITVVAFIPLFFLDGMEGRMLKPLGVAFIVSLFSSLLVAVTLTPVMCSYMISSDRVLKRSDREPRFSAWLKRGYKRMLEAAMRRKTAVLSVTGALLVGTIIVFSTLGSSFLPPFNEGSLTINTTVSPGISLEESDKTGRMVEQILMDIPEIETVARKTGRAELDEHSQGVNGSEYEAPYTLGARDQDEFLADVRERLSVLAGVNVEIGQPISHRIDAMLSGTKANIAVKLFGTDLTQMYALGTRIKNEISAIEGITDVNVEPQVERPQLHIVPNRQMLARYGITLPEFSEFISVSLGGEVVSQVYDNERTFDLTVKVADDERSTIERIENLLIDADEGKIPLSYVAEVLSTGGPNTIGRENVKRKLVISANIVGGDLGGAVESIQQTIKEKIVLPEDYFIEYGGQFESQQTASRTLTFASIVALLIVFMMLYQEFKKLKLASMIMLSLPFAMIGGVGAIWVTSGVVSIPAIIGFISLLGIAVRNGILLVSRYEALRVRGESLYESVLHGSVDRLNPILMTSISSMMALIPLALGGEVSGNEIQSPMAKVILGGLLTSTLLNIFVVPMVYFLLNKRQQNSVIETVQIENIS